MLRTCRTPIGRRRCSPFLSPSGIALALGAPLSVLAFQGLGAQEPFSIEDILSPGYASELVAARAADRIAWIEYERGMRNVYTAASPGFEPVRLTEFTNDDGVDLSDLQISNDGSVVAFIRGHTPNREGWIANPSSDPGGGERAVWAVRTDGGQPWKVVEAWNAALSPDGRSLIYGRWLWTQDEPADCCWLAPVSQATAEPIHQAASAPLFRVFGDNRSPVWSPDSRRIAFVSGRGDHSFIGIFRRESPRVTYLAPGVDRDEAPAWSPDGNRVAFIRRPGLPFGSRARRGENVDASAIPVGLEESRFAGGYDFSIWVADASTGQGRELWHSPPGDTTYREVRELHWAGEHVLFSAEPDGWRHYYAVSVSDPRPEPILLTPGQGIAEHISISPGGETLFYATNAGDIDRRHLWRVATGGGEAVQLTEGDGIDTYPAAVASGEQVAVLHASWRQPQSVALVSAGGGEPRIITRLPPEFPLDHHVVPEAVTLTAEDGFEFYNQLFIPRDLQPGERRPALIFIHGGSRRQMLLGYHYMHFYHMAYAMNQYFANRGYVVLSVNYRSGIGYGRDFRNAPGIGRRGNTEYRDIIAAGRYLQSRPDVDPERVGLWGLSYGGILTAQGLARNSDVFAAGVDMAGVHFWGEVFDPENTMYSSSSASQVAKWTSPVLLIHGDDDRNVDFSQTVGLVQALRANGVPFELIVFPDEVHDFLIHRRWLTSFGATDEFFQRVMVRGEAVTAGASR